MNSSLFRVLPQLWKIKALRQKQAFFYAIFFLMQGFKLRGETKQKQWKSARVSSTQNKEHKLIRCLWTQRIKAWQAEEQTRASVDKSTAPSSPHYTYCLRKVNCGLIEHREGTLEQFWLVLPSVHMKASGIFLKSQTAWNPEQAWRKAPLQLGAATSLTCWPVSGIPGDSVTSSAWFSNLSHGQPTKTCRFKECST